jgi:hypothetical protein
MNKKLVFLTIIGTYLSFILFAPAIFAITPEISIEVDENEIDEPIKPSVSDSITFRVKFKLQMSGFQKWFNLRRRLGRMLTFGLGYLIKLRQLPTANLSIYTEQPNWCEVSLNEDSAEYIYNNEFEEMSFTLTLKVKENAPALEKGKITISADYLGIGGIDATSNSTNISFMTAYVSNISVDAKSSYSLTPNIENIISINVTNNGNGITNVYITDIEKEKWNITTASENIIGIGETKEVLLKITPPKKFDNESISFTLEPMSTVENVDDKYRQGENVDFSITFYNDGSLDEDDGEIDITNIIIIAFVIIIILVILYLIFRKKE